MTSVLDYQANCAEVERAAQSCQEQGIHALFLPECFYSMSNGLEATPHLVDGVAGDEHYERIRSLAKTYSVALLGGSAATRHNQQVVNRAYNFNDQGEDLGQYDKMHLFSCDLGGDKKIVEADIYHPGHERKIIHYKDLAIGLGICFDLRFPTEAWAYREQGANLLTYSSAFTVPTGKAHWHALLRARAIETQCFVVACGQYGQHNDRIKTYGHSLVVDPWGEIILDAKEGAGLHTFELDLAMVNNVRKKISVGSQ